MPPLHHLNPPPHPFWDFVAGIEDHPFFAAYAPRDAANDAATGAAAAGQPQQPEATQANAEPSEKARGKQTATEDPPEVDPSTVKPDQAREGPCGRRGWHGRESGEGCERGRRSHGCRGGPRGRGGPFGQNPFGGPPPFMFGPGGHPFWAGPRHHSRPDHPHHPHHPHHPRHGHRGPPRDTEGQEDAGDREGRGFDLGQFLNNLGERLGVDLAGAADNLGLNNFTAPRSNEEVDFEPRTDIFDSETRYTIHLSLPGAKKEDVGVDWDGENSILRITGVVHRPGVDEQMLAQLVVNGRKRENGVFEKAIRLGTKRDPASVDVAGIGAKMNDGVLVVTVPKVKKEHAKRDVPISGSVSPRPNPGPENEKDLLFDADEEMYDAATEATPAATHEVTLRSTENKKNKEEESRDDRSETAGKEEPLPRYSPDDKPKEDSDWERASDDEGEYVKINVD